MAIQVVFGAYGGANIGDEAILYSVIRLLESQGIKTDIVIGTGATDGHSSALKDPLYNGIRFVGIRDFFTCMKSCFKANLLIGGGQLIDGSAGVKLPIIQVILALIVKLTGGNIKIAAVGVFHLNTYSVKLFYSFLFWLADEINVRDEAGFKSIAFSKSAIKKAKVTADVVFSLWKPNKNEAKEVPATDQRNKIVLAVHSAPHVAYMKESAAVEFVNKLVNNYGDRYEVVIAAHDLRESFDLDFANRIVAKSLPQQISLVTFQSVNECLEFYSNVAVVVSARMHPLILGAVSHCNIVPLQGSSKVNQFAKLVAVEEQTLEYLNSVDLSDLDTTLGLSENENIPSQERMSELSKKARDGLMFDSLVN